MIKALKPFLKLRFIKVILLIISTGLLISVTWNIAIRSKVKAPGNETSSLVVDKTGTVKKSVSCDFFDVTDNEIAQFSGLKKIEKGNMGNLNSGFPQKPIQSELCGNLAHLDTVFFISELGGEDILNYYQVELAKQGYNISDIKPGIESGDKVIEIRNNDGIGSVYSYGDKAAYAISFNLLKN